MFTLIEPTPRSCPVGRIFATPDAILGHDDTDLGCSEWLRIDQHRIDAFAEITGDKQWLHVDPERARNGPFKTTIAHGYLTLSLINHFLPQIIEVRGWAWGVNYGCDKIRFISPVKVGSRIRGRGQLLRAQTVPGGGVQSVVRMTVEIDGTDKPACIADTISRYYTDLPAYR